MLKPIALISIVALTTSCELGAETAATSSSTAAQAHVVELSSDEGAAIVRLLNYGGTDLDDLRLAGLERSTAFALLAHRDGTDERFGTADDNLFESIGEALEVGTPSPEELASLADTATLAGWTPGQDPGVGTFNGVRFTLSEAEQTQPTTAASRGMNNGTMGPIDVDYGGSAGGSGFGGVYGMHCYAVPRHAEAANWQQDLPTSWPASRGYVPGLSAPPSEVATSVAAGK